MPKSIDQIEQSIANQSEKYWASMRTNLSLVSRSKKVNKDCYDQLKDELSDILDSGILSYPQTLYQVGLNPEQSLDERKEALDVVSKVSHDTNEERFLKNMAYKSDIMRKSNWSWRIGQEAEEKQKLKWHPFFVTLTVDPSKADPKHIWTETREFRKYIRKLADIVCNVLGHEPCRKKPYRPESDYVTYAGVIEHGKSREHHHGHFVIWLRAIPPSWRVCPNKGKVTSKRTDNECLPMSTVWPWSGYDTKTGRYLSPALYFRSVGDVWEHEYKFVLPIDKKTGKPLKVSIPRIAGYYITKYLSKEHKEWHHRMKATRNLGIKKLKDQINKMDLPSAQALTWRAHNSKLNLSLMQIHSAPLGLVRRLAKQRVYLLKFRARQLDLMTLLTSNSQIFIKMLQSVQNGSRPDRMHSSEFYDWVSQFHPVPKEYCEVKMLRVHKILRPLFPTEKQNVKPIKLGGNEIGYS